jgi:integrase
MPDLLLHPSQEGRSPVAKPAPKPRAKVRGVFERPADSNIWWIQYFENGRRHRERVGTRANAITLYQKRKTQILTGAKLPELQRRLVTLGELADDAVNFSKANHARPQDFIGKTAMLKLSPIARRPASTLTLEDFEGWIASLKVASATHNRYKAFLSKMFSEGIRHGKVKENPIKLVLRKEEPKGRLGYLTHSQFADLLTHISSQEKQDQVILACYTGMRFTEQFTTEIRQVDLKRVSILLEATKNGDNREVPLNREALAAVKRQLARRLEQGAKRTDLLFDRKQGGKGPVQPRWIHAPMEAAEIFDCTWHNLRHTFCSWHAMAGTPIKTLQELAGHRTIAMTARYMHLAPGQKAAAQERIVPGGPSLVKATRATRTATGKVLAIRA